MTVTSYQSPEKDAILYDLSGVAETSASTVRHAETIHGSATFIGHCLGTAEEMREAARRYGESHDSAELTQLPGSYATIAAEGCHATVLADVAGQFPLYYTTGGAKTMIGTRATDLANKVGTEFDPVGAAGRLLGRPIVGYHRTVYNNVQQLPPGHALAISPEGRRVWKYGAVDAERVTYDEAAEQVREALLSSIARRQALFGNISTDFSGGIDSSPFAFLLAARQEGARCVDAYHSTHEEIRAGDTPYARRLAALDERIALHEVIIPKALLPYNGLLASSVATDLPQILTGTKERFKLRCQAIAAAGHDVHLTGHGGDALFHVGNAYLADMWRTNTLRHGPRIIRDTTLLAQFGYHASLAKLRRVRKWAHTTPAEELLRIAEALSGELASPGLWFPYNKAVLDVLTPTMKRQLAAAVAEQAERHELFRGDMSNFAALQSLANSAASQQAQHEIAAPYGVRLHAPYLDSAVVRAALQLAGHLRANPRRFKPLLEDALSGTVPSSVFMRTTKGNYSAETFHGIRRNRRELCQWLGSDSYLAQHEIIDPNAMQKVVTETALGADGAPGVIAQAVALETWLRAHYPAPGVSSPPPARPASLGKKADSLPAHVSVPLHVRFVEDEGGLISYNFQTGRSRLSYGNERSVLHLLQFLEGSPEAVSEALCDRYFATEASIIRADTAKIIGGLLERGIVRADIHRPFSITQAAGALSEKAAEVPMVYESMQAMSATARDYVRMARQLLRASKLVSRYTLADLTNMVQSKKKGRPPSDAETVRRLLTAGHVLKRGYVGRIACLELSLAVVLAEIKSGRAVEWWIGTAPDPRRYHAWPAIDGVPIQTPRDEIIAGNYTPFGVW